MKSLWLTLFALVATVLPLNSYLVAQGLAPWASLLWNDGSVLLGCVLTLFYFAWIFLRKIKVNYSGVHIALLGSVILFLTLLPAPLEGWWPATYWWLVLWMIPLVYFLLSSYGVRTITLLLIGIVCLHSFWALAQFLLQQDLGMHYWGEPRLTSEAPGVAKFSWVAGDHKIIRAYGPYPHPNSLAGVLVIGLLLIALLAERYRAARRAAAFLALPMVLALLATFSRSALLGALVLGAVFALRNKAVPSLWPFHNAKYFLAVGLIVLVAAPLWIARMSDPNATAWEERQTGVTWAWNVIAAQGWRGVGIGQYPLTLTAFLDQRQIHYQPWQIAPVHSVPLLLLAEWGIFLIVPLGAWLLYGVWRGGAHAWLLTPLVPMLALDHYFITQVAPLAWLVLAMVLLRAYQRPALAR